MSTASAHRIWQSWIRSLWVLALACALIVGAPISAAEAHAPGATAVSIAAGKSSTSVQQLSAALAIDTSADADHACPLGAAHACQQSCAGGACHAMTFTPTSAIEPYTPDSDYEWGPRGVGYGHDIAPLIHPPNR